MKCLNCNSDKFTKKKVRFNPEVKGTLVGVVVKSFVCKQCQNPLMDAAMMSELRKTAADQYRIDHDLLTSEQIKAYRDSLGMSQAAFARYLNVGEASIKRWETYFIQDASQDDHIRLKCDEAYAEMNYLDVYWKKHQPNLYSGQRRFNFQIFKNVALYLVEQTKESIIILNKLHFFVDFLHFRSVGESLTGARYVPLKYGPCPDQYRTLYDCLLRSGVIKEKKNHCFEPVKKSDLSLFDDQEKKTLEHILQIYKKKGGEYLYKLSHKERGFVETKECDFISYDCAQSLKV